MSESSTAQTPSKRLFSASSKGYSPTAPSQTVGMCIRLYRIETLDANLIFSFTDRNPILR